MKIALKQRFWCSGIGYAKLSKRRYKFFVNFPTHPFRSGIAFLNPQLKF